MSSSASLLPAVRPASKVNVRTQTPNQYLLGPRLEGAWGHSRARDAGCADVACTWCEHAISSRALIGKRCSIFSDHTFCMLPSKYSQRSTGGCFPRTIFRSSIVCSNCWMGWGRGQDIGMAILTEEARVRSYAKQRMWES